jgi:hypothetical protein
MFRMRIGKVAVYFTTCGDAVLEASVNLYSEYLTKESREGFGDLKIEGQVILDFKYKFSPCCKCSKLSIG